MEDSESDRFKTRMARGGSLPGGFDILQTLKSPLAACVASISDFCFDDDACHASEVIGEGPRELVKVCRMVKMGRRVAIRMEPFWYLGGSAGVNSHPTNEYTQWHMFDNPKPVPTT